MTKKEREYHRSYFRNILKINSFEELLTNLDNHPCSGTPEENRDFAVDLWVTPVGGSTHKNMLKALLL